MSEFQNYFNGSSNFAGFEILHYRIIWHSAEIWHSQDTIMWGGGEILLLFMELLWEKLFFFSFSICYLARSVTKCQKKHRYTFTHPNTHTHTHIYIYIYIYIYICTHFLIDNFCVFEFVFRKKLMFFLDTSNRERTSEVTSGTSGDHLLVTSATKKCQAFLVGWRLKTVEKKRTLRLWLARLQ